ncbi:MAG: response regulator [Bradyrhizobium sp.]|uniref:response regulator n=1 Tax=Bradyrhizobium sp. TaxID=376 RepID=UPI001DE92F36|nr:response regulator [Bradyrhizobium sp.]MBV9562020.1 response regulator [Bradyrhizobium sp.]
MPRILVIDDDHSTRLALQALLTRKSFDVAMAPNGRTGLQLISSLGFDAVIIDMFMPGVDGIATLRELVGLNPNLPFIAMSGCAFTDRRQGAPDFLGMATRLGAAAALQKPFSAAELLKAIARAFDIGAPRREPLRNTEPVSLGAAS